MSQANPRKLPQHELEASRKGRAIGTLSHEGTASYGVGVFNRRRKKRRRGKTRNKACAALGSACRIVGYEQFGGVCRAVLLYR